MFWYAVRRGKNDYFEPIHDCGYYLVEADTLQEAVERATELNQRLHQRGANYWVCNHLIRGPFAYENEARADYLREHPDIGDLSRFDCLDKLDKQ